MDAKKYPLRAIYSTTEGRFFDFFVNENGTQTNE